MSNPNTSFIHRDFFEVVGSGITKVADAAETTQLGSFLGRSVVRPGIAKLGSVFGSVLGTLSRSLSRDYSSWQETADTLEAERQDLAKRMQALPESAWVTLEKCIPLIIQFIPQDPVGGLFSDLVGPKTARDLFGVTTVNDSFSNIFKAFPSSRKEFVLSTKNVMNLFERAKWNINNLSLAWKRALEETCLQNTAVNGPKRIGADVDETVTLSNQRLTKNQLRWIARYIPKIKKLHFKTVLVSPEMIALCKRRFPKLQEITLTDTLEHVSKAEAAVRGALLRSANSDDGLLRDFSHRTDPNYVYCRHRRLNKFDLRFKQFDMQACAEGRIKLEDTPYGRNPYALMHSGHWYKRLKGTTTIQIPPRNVS